MAKAQNKSKSNEIQLKRQTPSRIWVQLLNNSGGGEEDIKLRLNIARRTFRQMNQVWNSVKFSRTTKIRLYNTLVIPVLLYGAETWKMTKRNNNEIDVFQGKCLRRII